MADAPPPAGSPDRTDHTRGRGRGLLGTRTRKIAAAIGGGFLAAVGAALAAGAFSTAERTLEGFPLRVRVLEPGTYFSGHAYAPYYVVPSDRLPEPTKLPAKQQTALLEDPHWALGKGGIAGSPQVVRLELRGKSEEPVIVNAIRIKVVGTQAPPSGWFAASPGCGPEPVRLATADLDAPGGRVTYIRPDGNPARTLALSVTRSDVELVELWASTRRSQVSWTAELLVSSAGETDRIGITDNGSPFRVTTETTSKGFRHVIDEGGRLAWQREPRWDRGIQAC